MRAFAQVVRFRGCRWRKPDIFANREKNPEQYSNLFARLDAIFDKLGAAAKKNDNSEITGTLKRRVGALDSETLVRIWTSPIFQKFLNLRLKLVNAPKLQLRQWNL